MVKKEDLVSDAVGAPTPLTSDHLKGTKWEDTSNTLHIESYPVIYIYLMTVWPQEGTLTDTTWATDFATNITPDVQPWVTLLESAIQHNDNIRTVLKRIKDASNEKKYISASYKAEDWNPASPCVNLVSLCPDKMKAAIERLKIDMNIGAPAASVAQLSSLISTLPAAPKQKEL